MSTSREDASKLYLLHVLGVYMWRFKRKFCSALKCNEKLSFLMNDGKSPHAHYHFQSDGKSPTYVLYRCKLIEAALN